MKLTKIILFPVVFFAALQLSMAQQDPKAEKILDQMSQKYKSMNSYKAVFSQAIENPMSKINETMEGEIVVQGKKYKLNMAGQEIIFNGSAVYTYLKDANEVNISVPEEGNDELNPTNIFSMYKKGYKYGFLEERKEGAKTYEVIELAPEDRNNPIFKIQLVIDKKDKSLVSWKMFNKNNGNRYLYIIKDFTPNVPVTASTFNFDKTKYKGVQVIDLR